VKIFAVVAKRTFGLLLWTRCTCDTLDHSIENYVTNQLYTFSVEQHHRACDRYNLQADYFDDDKRDDNDDDDYGDRMSHG